MLNQKGILKNEDVLARCELLVKEKTGGFIIGVLLIAVGLLISVLSIFSLFMGLVGVLFIIAGAMMSVIHLNKVEQVNNHAINSIQDGDDVRAKILFDGLVAKGKANSKTNQLLEYVNKRFG